MVGPNSLPGIVQRNRGQNEGGSGKRYCICLLKTFSLVHYWVNFGKSPGETKILLRFEEWDRVSKDHDDGKKRNW